MISYENPVGTFTLESGADELISAGQTHAVARHLRLEAAHAVTLPRARHHDLPHRLKDLGRPERVWQLCPREGRVDYPPLRSLDAFGHNLPTRLTALVGRQAETAAVSAALAVVYVIADAAR